MPINRHALIRIKTIDKCLQNRRKRWMIADLIQACSDALYEYEGTDKEVSLRTIRNDLALMRSDKLGYNAPIVIYDKKFYTYEDADYSITNIPLSTQDMDTLTEVVEILKQFKGFSHFQELSSVVSKLEDKIYSEKYQQAAIIDFEKNEHLVGLEHLDVLYKAVQNAQVVQLKYQSFKARVASIMLLNPWLLKEHRNRWFVVGTLDKKKVIMTLALDRIQEITPMPLEKYYKDPSFDAKEYYKDVVGVTVNEGIEPHTVTLFVEHVHAPYIISKPLHPSQQIIKRGSDGIIITLFVRPNFELERDILGFGEGVQVLSPRNLRTQISKRLGYATAKYAAKNV